MSEQAVRRSVHRPPATATWRHTHYWGKSLGDNTVLSVTRTDGGGLRIAYGRESIEIRGDLLGVFAEMVAAASTWSDNE